MGSECYVYAILPEGEPVPAELAGLDGHPLRIVTAHKLAAVVSSPAAPPSPPTIDRLLRHEAIVEAIARAAPALPVRFGTVLADATAVCRALAERAQTLTDDLRRAGGKVELGVTLLPETTSSGAEKSDRADHSCVDRPGVVSRERQSGEGGAYLRARLAQHQRATEAHTRAAALAELLDSTFSPWVLERRTSICQAPRLMARAQYLLEPANVERCQSAFDDLRRAWRQTQPNLRCLLSGPWPPYSFVTGHQFDGQAESTASGARPPPASSTILDPMWLAQIL